MYTVSKFNKLQSGVFAVHSLSSPKCHYKTNMTRSYKYWKTNKTVMPILLFFLWLCYLSHAQIKIALSHTFLSKDLLRGTSHLKVPQIAAKRDILKRDAVITYHIHTANVNTHSIYEPKTVSILFFRIHHNFTCHCNQED